MKKLSVQKFFPGMCTRKNIGVQLNFDDSYIPKLRWTVIFLSNSVLVFTYETTYN